MNNLFSAFKNYISKIKVIRLLYEKILLFQCSNKEFLEKNLLNKINFDLMLQDKNIENEYSKISEEIEQIEIPNLTGGMGPTDRKVIYKLIKAIKPKKVLEIGTHIGSSTVIIAKALYEENENNLLKTVDFRDVNDDLNKPWLKFKSKNSPLNNLKFLNVQNIVEFKTEDSLEFLKKETDKYNLIFLDGSHRSDHVYKEVALALKLLAPNSLILLHDYYPNSNPIPGPNEAVKRIRRENKLINIHHFANWQSSLAILFKNNT